MLTPDKIKQKSFQTTGRGSYRAEDVDSFLNEVSASYEQMFKENGDLVKKISIFAKKIEEYRADEESLKMALLNAQKLADKIVAEANETASSTKASAQEDADKIREEIKAESDSLKATAQAEIDEMLANAKAEAEAIVSDANRQSREILGNINRKVTHESLVFDMLKKESSDFKSKLIAMYKEHISLIQELPEIANAQLDAEEGTVVEETAPVVEAESEAEEFVVIEEAAPQIEVEEEVEAEESETVVEEVTTEEASSEEVADEVAEEVITEAVEEAEVEEVAQEADVAPVKKTFKLDLSKIDFASMEENAEPVSVNTTVTEEAPVEEESEEKGSISFKSFFKKK